MELHDTPVRKNKKEAKTLSKTENKKRRINAPLEIQSA